MERIYSPRRDRLSDLSLRENLKHLKASTEVLAPFPKLSITFSMTNGFSSVLASAPQFTCTFIDIAPKLRSALLQWLHAYAHKNPISWPFPNFTPSFTSSVLRHLTTIPFGSTQTYSEVAKAAHSPRAARAVGQACHFNPLPLLIPCHRVLASHGLGGFGPGTDLKSELLRFEGVINF
ncbi:MAG: MGMT family protein [Verrucomicrobia bacterium]|nr:MGMT family protein [Verrucomicrobiota bacterium]